MARKVAQQAYCGYAYYWYIGILPMDKLTMDMLTEYGARRRFCDSRLTGAILYTAMLTVALQTMAILTTAMPGKG